ncbi:MAG: GNAT family N-acetyltransferase [Pantoea sp.]|uniref:GNAT family N-acetyltransferase n=1 Tax=Pantoea sp. TaxID=69393 RepID=UPI0039E21DF2
MKCRHAKESELKNVCDLLVSEFYNDPVLRFAFRQTNRDKRLVRLKFFFEIYINLARKFGGILLSQNDVGVLVYFRPEIMEVGNLEHERIDSLLQQECGSDYENITALMNGLYNYHPYERPHYYVFLIAVRDSFRRKGVATELLSALNIILDQEQMACYAECTASTTQNLFEQVGYRAVNPPLIIEGFPQMFPVWREPTPTM